MAGVWSQVRVLDIVLPNNGSLTPGSGTVYIGGPRLPSELRSAGYNAALVFYTGTGVVPANIKYWFIAHSSNAVSHLDSLEFGWVSNLGIITPVQTIYFDDSSSNFSVNLGFGNKKFNLSSNGAPSVLSDNGIVISDSSNVGLQLWTGGLNDILGDTIDIHTSSGDLVIRPQAGQDIAFKSGATSRLAIHNLWTTSPSLKANAANTILDQWTSQTINQVIGGATMTANIDYRVTPDFIIDIRGKIAFSAVPTTFDFSFPITCPFTIDSGPGSGVGMATFGDSAGVGTPRTIRTFMGGPGNTVFVQGGVGNPSGYQFNFFSMMGTVLKP